MPKKTQKIGTTYAKLPSAEGERTVLRYFGQKEKLLFVLTLDDRRKYRRYDLTPDGKFKLTAEDPDPTQLY